MQLVQHLLAFVRHVTKVGTCMGDAAAAEPHPNFNAQTKKFLFNGEHI